MEHQFIYHSLLCVGSTNWILVAENQECIGSDIYKPLQPNAEIQDCATGCEGVSSMFTFQGQSGEVSRCFCQTSANADGTCATRDLPDYDLYQYGIITNINIY